MSGCITSLEMMSRRSSNLPDAANFWTLISFILSCAGEVSSRVTGFKIASNCISYEPVSPKGLQIQKLKSSGRKSPGWGRRTDDEGKLAQAGRNEEEGKLQTAGAANGGGGAGRQRAHLS